MTFSELEAILTKSRIEASVENNLREVIKTPEADKAVIRIRTNGVDHLKITTRRNLNTHQAMEISSQKVGIRITISQNSSPTREIQRRHSDTELAQGTTTDRRLVNHQ